MAPGRAAEVVASLVLTSRRSAWHLRPPKRLVLMNTSACHALHISCRHPGKQLVDVRISDVGDAGTLSKRPLLRVVYKRDVVVVCKLLR